MAASVLCLVLASGFWLGQKPTKNVAQLSAKKELVKHEVSEKNVDTAENNTHQQADVSVLQVTPLKSAVQKKQKTEF